MFDLSLDQATKSPIPEDGAEPEGHQTPASQEHECMYTIYAAMNRIITLCPLLLRHDLLAIYYCTFTPWINMAELLVYIKLTLIEGFLAMIGPNWKIMYV